MANPQGETILINNQEVKLIPLGYCACGCGTKTQQVNKNKWKTFRLGHWARVNRLPWSNGGIKFKADGAILIYRPDHVRADSQGYVREHILICEKALGKPLPLGAEPHHVDGNRSNNSRGNLVLCQDHEYHMLLEQRIRAYHACGHANWLKCSFCKKYDDPSNMKVSKRRGRSKTNRNSFVGIKAHHAACVNEYAKNQRVKALAARNKREGVFDDR